MNLLALVQAATGEMGLPVPVFVAGNTARDAVQQLALLNAVGSELLLEHNWQALEKEFRFTTQYSITTGTVTSGSAVVTEIPSTTGLDTTYMVAGTGINQDTYVKTVDSSTQVTLSQAATISGAGQALTFGKTQYALPSDYATQIDRTHYDKSKRWAMLGPETPQQWQWLKSSYISTGPRLRYRIMGGLFQIWPIIATPEYLGFEYVSNGWVNPTTSPKQTLTLDTDVCMFPDRLMILGLKLKYFEAKGFETASIQRDYDRVLNQIKAADHGSPSLSMTPTLSEILIGSSNLPDTGYGF
jgi:hypothetical protein